ncbi:MAG: class I tRNA ligase family protein [Candidatus Hodgkinia cicadicola]
MVNRPLTRGLVESCEVTSWRQLVARRTGALAVHCASGQWYIKIDNDTRTRVCRMLTSVKFVPSSASWQILKLVATRPDWIISRRRLWGVYPLCFDTNRSNKVTWDAQNSSTVWHAWRKLADEAGVLDVWFDASAVFVLRGEQLPWRMVIEGADRHRGWFQSVLLSCVLTRNQLAFKTLIAHPFVMLNKAEKMSKSKQGVWLRGAERRQSERYKSGVADASLTENRVLSSDWMLKSANIHSKICNTLRWAVGVVKGEHKSCRTQLWHHWTGWFDRGSDCIRAE